MKMRQQKILLSDISLAVLHILKDKTKQKRHILYDLLEKKHGLVQD